MYRTDEIPGKHLDLRDSNSVDSKIEAVQYLNLANIPYRRVGCARQIPLISAVSLPNDHSLDSQYTLFYAAHSKNEIFNG